MDRRSIASHLNNPVAEDRCLFRTLTAMLAPNNIPGVSVLDRNVADPRGAFVVATASARKRDFVRALGADEVIDYHSVAVAPDHEGLEELARLVEQGKLRVYVERTFPLELAAQGHAFLETRPAGKVVHTT
jgi:NADPH:quinone reductase-like Zn-dependent oxidoreductase